MRTKHLGCDAYFAGSFFSYIVERKRPAGTGEAAMMQEAWTRIKQVYKDPHWGRLEWGRVCHSGLVSFPNRVSVTLLGDIRVGKRDKILGL